MVRRLPTPVEGLPDTKKRIELSGGAAAVKLNLCELSVPLGAGLGSLPMGCPG